MKDFFIWLSTISFLGFLGSTSRYVYELGTKKERFSWVKWFLSSFIGITIAILAGFFCNHLNLSAELTYGLVGISAISSKELMELLPNIVTSQLNRKVK